MDDQIIFEGRKFCMSDIKTITECWDYEKNPPQLCILAVFSNGSAQFYPPTEQHVSSMNAWIANRMRDHLSSAAKSVNIQSIFKKST